MTEAVKEAAARLRPEESSEGDPALFFRCHVFCCMNERPPGHERGCCKEKGAIRLRNYLKARAKELGLEGVRINQSGCLDRCERGPVIVVYPEAVWYTYVDKDDIDEIIREHLKHGRIVERLRI
jgi:(2Fe-2S) ferredoxin